MRLVISQHVAFCLGFFKGAWQASTLTTLLLLVGHWLFLIPLSYAGIAASFGAAAWFAYSATMDDILKQEKEERAKLLGTEE